MQTIDAEELRGRTREFVGKGDGANPPTSEREVYLEKLVEQAIEHLKIGHEKIQSVELEKWASEAELKRFRDDVKGQIDIKLREIQARIKRGAAQLAAAEQRAIAAEERANKAEASVRRLEKQLRTEMMRRGARLERSAA